MSNPSNFYAEKILAQHPLAMWSLNDESYYLTKISEADRDMSTWTVTGGTATTVTDTTSPFVSSYTSRIDGTATPTFNADARVYLSSPSTFSSNGFTISFYLKTQYITNVSAGYGSGNIRSISSAVPDVSTGTVSYVTYTTTTNHGFSNGEYVEIVGNSVELYDTVGFISNKTDNTFRIYFSPASGQGNGTGGQVSGGKTDSVFINPADYPTNSWIPVSFTFNDNVSSQKMLLSFSYSQTSPQFFINGLTIGKDSQPFNGESLGQTSTIIPRGISSSVARGIQAKSYGTEEYSAYYVASGIRINTQTPTYSAPNITLTTSIPHGLTSGQSVTVSGVTPSGYNGTWTTQTGTTASTLVLNIGSNPGAITTSGNFYLSDELYAKNSGVSMCYGSDTSMRIYPHLTSGQPSFIFPGFGMLNEIGRYKPLTLQTLIRIAANNSTPKRIIGPLASTDGVYVTKDIISLKIGNTIGSFALSEMYRPMVMQFKVGNGFAKLSIDGEEVISLQINNSSLSLPEKLDGSSNSQDWLGIYAYSDIPLIEVGSLAMFPYEASDTLGRLNFVYAQSVNIPTNSNSSFGQTISPDFALSNYVNNYNYPSFQAKWEQASILENLNVSETNALETKQYVKPGTATSLYDSDRLFLDIYERFVASGESNTFLNLRPSTVVAGSGRNWTSNQGYFLINSYQNSEYLSNCIYGVFKSLESSATEQILLKIKDISNGNYFQVSIINTTVYYKYKYNSDSETQITTKSITQNTTFAIGFDIQKLIASDYNLFGFFSNKTNLQIFVGGQDTLANTFSGNIYKVGLCSERNSTDILALFSANGILTNSSSYSDLLSKIASYTLYGLNAFGKINLDVGTSGYWQDYVPLSKLAKTVIGESGEESIALDFIQINLDYEEPRTYSSGNFVTSSLPVKGYVTFQTLSSGANQDLSNFATTQSASSTRVIDASTFSATTKYEFVNGMIINPPTNVDLSTLAIVLHLDIKTDASIIKPVRTRFIQLAAQSFNKNIPNKLGTKYSLDVYPYRYDAAVTNKATTYPYDYNSKNQYLVYKQSSPHLYLTRHSGYRIVGVLPTDNVHRGLYANLGDFSADKKITSLQMSILADFESFSGSQKRIFSIKTNNGEIKFYASTNVAGDASKAKISTDSSIPVIFYLNGRKVGSPVIAVNEWNVLGISFPEPLNISNSQGRISISSNIVITDISCHYANPTELDQKSEPLLWSQIEDNKWRIPVPTQTPTRVGNSITLTTTGDHNLVVGERLTFYDIQPSNYGEGFGGGILKISVVNTSSSFTYENSYAPTTPITTAGTVVGTWEYARIPNYYAIYGSSPDSIYDQFTGRNKIIIDVDDTSSSLQLSQYQYLSYIDVNIDTFTLDIK